MKQKNLIERLIKASNKINKNRKSTANYIPISVEFIQQQADERKISFDDMVEIIKNECMPKTEELNDVKSHLSFIYDDLKKMKYYFITYQATNRQGSISIWNNVIDMSPMAFIKKITKIEEEGANTYYGFVVINTCEITKEEFNEYEGHF